MVDLAINLKHIWTRPLVYTCVNLSTSDVNANIELYEPTNLIKYLERTPPFGFNSPSRNGGSFWKGKLTFPPLQQRWK
jgi:hypothetical protein